MRLRRLESKDAPLMLEWMHDPSVVEYMNADFASKKVYREEEKICQNIR